MKRPTSHARGLDPRTYLAIPLLALLPARAFAQERVYVDDQQRMALHAEGELSFHPSSFSSANPSRIIGTRVDERGSFVSASPNSKVLLVASLDRSAETTGVTLFNLDGEEQSSLAVVGGYYRFRVSDDAQVIVAADRFVEGVPTKYDFVFLSADGEVIAEISEHLQAGARDALASGGERYLVAGTRLEDQAEVIEAYDPRSGALSWSHVLDAGERARELALSADGSLAIVSLHPRVRTGRGALIILGAGGEALLRLDSIAGKSFFPRATASSPNGRWAAVILDQRKLALFDMSQLSVAPRVIEVESASTQMPLMNSVFDLRLNDRGMIVASGIVCDAEGVLANLMATQSALYAGCLTAYDSQGKRLAFHTYEVGVAEFARDSIGIDSESGLAHSRVFLPFQSVSLSE